MCQFVSTINCFFFGLIWVFPPINIHAQYDFRCPIWFPLVPYVGYVSGVSIFNLVCISHQNRLLLPQSCLSHSSINSYRSVRTPLTTRSPRARHVFCRICSYLCFFIHMLLFLFFFFWLSCVRVSRMSHVCVSFVLFCFSRSYVCILFLLVLT